MIGGPFVTSTASNRLWRVFKEAGRPFPKLSEDDVVDYCIMEAVAMKIAEEDKDQEDEQERKNWKKDPEALKKKLGQK